MLNGYLLLSFYLTSEPIFSSDSSLNVNCLFKHIFCAAFCLVLQLSLRHAIWEKLLHNVSSSFSPRLFHVFSAQLCYHFRFFHLSLHAILMTTVLSKREAHPMTNCQLKANFFIPPQRDSRAFFTRLTFHISLINANKPSKKYEKHRENTKTKTAV